MTQSLPNESGVVTSAPTLVPASTQAAPPQPVSLTDRVLVASDLGDTVEEARKLILSLRTFAKFLFSDGSVWEVGQAVPNSGDTLAVFAAFNCDLVSEDTADRDRLPGDVRFYTIPVAGISDPLEPSLFCYTMNRGSPVTAVERMTLETFVREVGREWYNLAVVQGVVEEVVEDEEDDE
jgi:hypothetical protein